MNRRSFLHQSGAAGLLTLLSPHFSQAETNLTVQLPPDWKALPNAIQQLDLTPARWLWYPSQRTLANTFILFRKTIQLSAPVAEAKGWILGDSRYKLYANGQRIQFGPAPCDPRYTEADPVDLTAVLQQGDNCIGAEVLYYGFGDGTWPIGKPGFIFRLDIRYENGATEQIISDESWQCHLARSWQPGQYKRWYLRALQEEFDARKYPYGWTKVEFETDDNWLSAMPIPGASHQPTLTTGYADYQYDSSGAAADCALRQRHIPLLKETLVPAKQLTTSHYILWQRPPEEYFEMIPPNAYEVERKSVVASAKNNGWQVRMEKDKAAVLTFEWPEQIVGFPYFTITAPEGTIVELLVQEAHDPLGEAAVMNNHFNAWTRFICKAGRNEFECFDYESLRWLQLHIRTAEGRVTVEDVGVRRRLYDWPHRPDVQCSDTKIQRVLDASVNTILNAAQDQIVDGMGRERQQYSGDVGRQLHAIFSAFGENQLPARYLNTWSQGLTKEGFFLDCWPAYDRLARLMERQLDLTPWGPLLDHGLGFNFDAYYYYLYTGDLTALKEVYPRLLTFMHYLQKLQGEDGLLPVENIGVPKVWIDHDAFQQQRHKQCAFNLYAAAALSHALAKLCTAFKDSENQQRAEQLGQELLTATIQAFWSPKHQLFVNNLPWLSEENGIRLDDRSLATAVLFDQFPTGAAFAKATKVLADVPSECGLSYPANAGWRLWALAKSERTDVILHELRTRWHDMQSVQLNNTLQEAWSAEPDSNAQWSHCPVAPLYVTYMNLAGIQPLKPGFERVQVYPQLGDLDSLQLTAQTVRGPIRFGATGKFGNRELTVELPDGMDGELVLSEKEELDLSLLRQEAGKKVYALPQKVSLRLQYR